MEGSNVKNYGRYHKRSIAQDIGVIANSAGKVKDQKAFPPENPHVKAGTVSQELTRRIGRELKERTWPLLSIRKW